ncbi:hypothetical protein [Eudoraea adriatica]|uniref:hypothetical protein n=1 Tax=Eudoraea adriatica TaxID=446681 RepID=UPI0003804F04|nr:hypothetical protein [Eudoraea adriatica]
MKKIIFAFAMFIAFSVSAQDSYYTVYTFVVEPQNQATVYNLVEDYYSKNKPEDVFVRLFEIHFAGGDATHSIVFSGSQEALGNMYGGGPNDSFSLFLTRLNQHIKDGSGSAMGRNISLVGETNVRYRAQRMYFLDVKDTETFDAAHKKFHSAHNPAGVLVNMGAPTVGMGTGNYNRWVMVGFKDMKTAIGGANKLLAGDALKAREKAWEDFVENNGGVEMKGSGLRLLLGAW